MTPEERIAELQELLRYTAAERDEAESNFADEAKRLWSAAARVETLENQALKARGAIRHALQFLKDSKHKGDGHLLDCIDACEAVLRFEPPQLAGRGGN